MIIILDQNKDIIEWVKTTPLAFAVQSEQDQKNMLEFLEDYVTLFISEY